MLARFLRAIILSQITLGGALGYWLSPLWGGHGAGILLFALAMPWLLLLITDTVCAIRSRNPQETGPMWWRSLGGEIVASVKIFMVRQPWAGKAPAVQVASSASRGIPVVLVHGYVCNHRIWDDVQATLLSRGHSCVSVDLEPLFTSIDDYAPIIEKAVLALMQQTGAKQVALIGHSMGGLAIRAWVRKHGLTRLARAITLGTPHAGTRIAPVDLTPNAQQMRWGSRWLAELAASENAEIRAKFLIALTPQDNIVYPQREQVMPGIKPVVFEGIGHLQMCVHPPVIAWLVESLQNLAPEGKTA